MRLYIFKEGTAVVKLVTEQIYTTSGFLSTFKWCILWHYKSIWIKKYQ